MKKFIVIMVAALGLTSCFKEVGFDTTIELYPKLQEISNGEFAVAEGVTAYAYYVSGGDWKVLSYEDAVAKVITNTKTNATKTEPAVEAVPYAEDGETPDALGRLKLKTNKEHVLLVAVYPAFEMWAYRQYQVGVNLPTTTMKFHFRPWKLSEYVDSGWTFNIKPLPAAKPEEGEGKSETTQE